MTCPAGCECYDCTATGKTVCAKTRGCLLRDKHAGPCKGVRAYLRFTARTIYTELRDAIVRRFKGRSQ